MSQYLLYDDQDQISLQNEEMINPCHYEVIDQNCQDSFYYAQDLFKSTSIMWDTNQSNSNPGYEVVNFSSESQQNLNKVQVKQRNQKESNNLEVALGSPNQREKKTNTKTKKRKGNGPESNKRARSLIRASLRKKECKTEFQCYKRDTNQENLNANKYSLFIQEFEKQKRIKRDDFHYYQTYAKKLLDDLQDSKYEQ